MRKRITYKLMYLLVLFMPLHYYICELFLKFTSIDNLFRDFLILLLLVLVVLRNGKIITNKVGCIVILNCMILIIYALVSFAIWSFNGTFNVLRTYILPMLIYFICSSFKFSAEEFYKLQKVIIIEMTVISFYGVFQAFILGDQFAIRLGYDSVAGHLNSTSFYIGGFFGYQRSTGTFVSPNICGAILMMVLIVHLLDSERYISKWRSFVTFVLIIGTTATFSRSSIVGGILGILFYAILNNKLLKLKKPGAKRVFLIPAAIVALGILWMIDQKILNGLFTRMVQSSFRTSVAGSDSSLQKHITELFEPLEKIINHPFGMGFGSNGPMATVSSSIFRNVESSVYLMMYEIGIIPAILFFVPYIAVIISTIKNKSYKYYVPMVISICCLTIYLLLPSVQSYELLFYSLMYIGFYYNSTVKTIYTSPENEEMKA